MKEVEPSFSIITVSFNSEATIEETILSVINQKYNKFEYIIIDGGSTDQTMNIIKKYEKNINKIISENDKGIYDAINKGIINSTNSIIGLIHSDDKFFSMDILSHYAKVFNEDIDIVFSNLNIVNKNNKIIRNWKSNSFKLNSFRDGWSPPHPTFFVKKKYYLEYGFYNLKYKIASDIDMMFRFLEIYKLKSFYLDITSVIMRSGGLSNKNIQNKVKLNLEIIKILKIYYGKKFSVFNFLFNKFFLKINQYL